MSDSIEIDYAKSLMMESQPDSWWMSLFLPRQINREFYELASVGFDEHQPLLLGKTLVATDSVVIAWCPLDDKCPWQIDAMRRVTQRANNIRTIASLTMQASQAVHDYAPAFALNTTLSHSGEVVTIDGNKFAAPWLHMIYQLPNSEIAFGETPVKGTSLPGLFFRWGRNGGGFLLPMNG